MIAHRDQYGLKVRMNFTVLHDNVSELPAVAALAQQLRVRLYLNLGTDRTFLFRHSAVGGQTSVGTPELTAALTQLERLARRDRSWLPRYSDLRYIPRHFRDVVQRDLPCAESQLKLMIHSQGGVGGCWGHDPHRNVRQMRIADVIASTEYRDEHERLFQKDCVGCGSNYSLNLRWRPSTYVQDAMWRLGRRSIADDC